MPISIKDIAEYNYCLKRGLNPLLSAICDVDINLRIELQRKMFPTIEKYYRWNWDHKPHYCEECLRPLHNYSAVYVSHILSRGAHPEMALDPRNNNILCFEHHNQYEFGDRGKMRIFAKNQKTIEKLKTEYSKLSR